MLIHDNGQSVSVVVTAQFGQGSVHEHLLDMALFNEPGRYWLDFLLSENNVPQDTETVLFRVWEQTREKQSSWAGFTYMEEEEGRAEG